MSKFRIEAQHELYIAYVVEAETEKQAIEKLQDLGDNDVIITEYCGSPKTWGVDECLLEKEGIVVDDEDAWVSCPLPTGEPTQIGLAALIDNAESKVRLRISRTWLTTEEVDDEG